MVKQSHDDVNYRAGNVGDGHCAACVNYRPAPSAPRDPHPHCTAVGDPIRPSGVCDIYSPKAVPPK